MGQLECRANWLLKCARPYPNRCARFWLMMAENPPSGIESVQNGDRRDMVPIYGAWTWVLLKLSWSDIKAKAFDHLHLKVVDLALKMCLPRLPVLEGTHLGCAFNDHWALLQDYCAQLLCDSHSSLSYIQIFLFVNFTDILTVVAAEFGYVENMRGENSRLVWTFGPLTSTSANWRRKHTCSDWGTQHG